ncbi:MAG: response regulator [Verrucomicrobiota bacterium]
MNESQIILLVDDSENDRTLMRIAFKKADFNIPLQEVHNGEEAIAYLKGESPYHDREKFPLPAVVLLDINMPMKDGFDVLNWVRSQPALDRLSIIILTTSMRTEDVERAFDLGTNSFLVKPSELGGLISMLRCFREWLGYNHFPPPKWEVGKNSLSSLPPPPAA